MRNFSTVILLLLSYLCSAQITNSGADIYIDNNAIIGLSGNLENYGTIENQGTISLKGDFINNNLYSSEGRLILNGLNQTIYSKNGEFSSIYVSSSDTCTKRFTSSFLIKDSLALQNGIIRAVDSVEITAAKNAFVSLGDYESYIDANFYRSGSENLYYPIGTNSKFAPVELQEIDNSDVLIGFRVYDSLPENTTFGKNAESAFGNVYWKKSIKSGSYNNAKISLSYNTEPTIPLGRYISVLQSDSVAGAYIGIGADEDAVSEIELYSVTSNEYATASYFTAGFTILAPWERLYIPNALSKNAPDINDKAVRVYGNVFQESGFRFVVSNQWGNTVFETNSLQEMENTGWDGKNKKTGNRETVGQYYYIISAVGKDGVAYEDAGSIWILD